MRFFNTAMPVLAVGIAAMACSSAPDTSGSADFDGGVETIDAGATRAACTAPATYRNLFVEILGKTPAEVDSKVNTAVQQMFHGDSNRTLYFELGADMATIEDIAHNDVRSEGMSYGLTIAVAMDMKAEFDKLWSYAKNCMQQPSGLFAWQMTSGACSPISRNAAPDGEEYFAMALMLASRRWGDSGAVDYGAEARKVMAAMLMQRPAGEFNADPAIVSFGPYAPFSDPSYVLPLFYSEWACFDDANAAFWNKAVADGRAYFHTACNATTGLAPYLAGFDGTPRSGHDTFNFDAWRVPMNIMMDFNLNTADAWQLVYAKTNAAFWMKEGLSSYGTTYNLDGTGKSGSHGAGLAGVNAMLAFALSPADAKKLLQAAWDASFPTGAYRYYDACLYVLSLLHISGKFNLFY